MMAEDAHPATRDAIGIWKAGVRAVRGDTLVRQWISTHADFLRTLAHGTRDSPKGRILVAAAGKAAASMSAGFLEGLLEIDFSLAQRTEIQVHIPRDGSAQVLEPLAAKGARLHIRELRPAHANVPTEEAVEATAELCRRVQALVEKDVLIVLLSGGGSALLVAPRPPVTLEDKLRATDFLFSRGADIESVNRIRGIASAVKSGGLIRQCKAGRIVTLAISDILGDPPELIAGGPTRETVSGWARAREVARRFDPQGQFLPASIQKLLAQPASDSAADKTNREKDPSGNPYHVLGNNESAVAAAAQHARELGYRVTTETMVSPETAIHCGERLARFLARLPARSCFISGGEPTVPMTTPGPRGRGGRNQHLVLGALREVSRQSLSISGDWCLLSAGTDGQDGNTTDAGAWINEEVLDTCIRPGLDPGQAIERYDSGTLLSKCSATLRTGYTGTNVCDLRIAIRT